MPIRTASVSRKISANGQALHQAMLRRTQAGAGDAPSAEEAALLEERRALKEEREKRKAQALEPRPTALDRLVRTRRAQPKATADGAKGKDDGKEVKKPKARRSRAEKHAELAAAQEAARKTGKGKPAAKPGK